jgi:hypothetical protein
MSVLKKLSPFYNLTLFYVLVSFILRIVLLFHPITQASFSSLDTIKIFTFGILSDCLVFTVLSGFLWLYLIFISNSKYLKPTGYIVFGLLVSLFLYVTFGNTILNEYGGALPEIGMAFIGLKTLLFGLLLFLPKYRDTIRVLLLSVLFFDFV